MKLPFNGRRHSEELQLLLTLFGVKLNTGSSALTIGPKAAASLNFGRLFSICVRAAVNKVPLLQSFQPRLTVFTGHLPPR